MYWMSLLGYSPIPTIGGKQLYNRMLYQSGLWPNTHLEVKYKYKYIWFQNPQIQIQIQIHLISNVQIQIQIQIQMAKYKYKYKYSWFQIVKYKLAYIIIKIRSTNASMTQVSWHKYQLSNSSQQQPLHEYNSRHLILMCGIERVLHKCYRRTPSITQNIIIALLH